MNLSLYFYLYLAFYLYVEVDGVQVEVKSLAERSTSLDFWRLLSKLLLIMWNWY